MICKSMFPSCLLPPGARVRVHVPSPKGHGCLLPPCAKQVGKQHGKLFWKAKLASRAFFPPPTIPPPPSAFQDVCTRGAGMCIRQMLMSP